MVFVSFQAHPELQFHHSILQVEPAIGAAIIGIVFAVKRGSGTPKPAREELEEYESRYVARKPAEKKETSSSCNSCGTRLKPTAKFCGKCGTPRS